MTSFFATSLATSLVMLLFGHSSLLRAAELPVTEEVQYEKAVLAFHQSHFDETLSLLEGILQGAPQTAPALELKALCLKAQGKNAEALKVYGALLHTGAAQKKPQYYFEVGCLLQKQKRFSAARPYLNAAIEGGFNVGAAHYFLGMIDYEEKYWDSAEEHFVRTLRSDANDLKTLAHFYLGLVFFKKGDALGALRGVLKARKSALSNLESENPDERKTAKDINEGAKKVFLALDRSQWFGSVALQTSFDSNVSLLSDSVTSGAQVSGKKTLKESLSAGGGYMSSPTKTVQFIGSYRTSLNYNFNSDAKTYDFFSHVPAVFLNYKPYSRFVPGLKIEGNYTFQNQAAPGSYIEYYPYSLTGEVGPYGRYEVHPHFITELDLFYKPKKYYGDLADGEDRRSGNGVLVRASVDYTSPWNLLAPTGYIAFENDNTVGANWRFNALSFGFLNTARVTRVDSILVGMDFAFSSYSDRDPSRNDFVFTFKSAWSRRIVANWNLLVDFNYMRDFSNLDSLFSYSRVFGGVGVSYSF